MIGGTLDLISDVVDVDVPSDVSWLDEVAGDYAYDPVDGARFRSELTPAKKLVVALLLEGLRLALRPESDMPMLRAREWIASDDTSDAYTFVSVCDVLGYEPDYIRRRFLEARARGVGLSVAVVAPKPAPDSGRPVAFMVMRRAAAG
jgi:hypothetical protein